MLDARKALQWNGASGALDKLRLKNPQAALVKLGQALDSLRSAQAAGANVGTLIALIEQVIASLGWSFLATGRNQPRVADSFRTKPIKKKKYNYTPN